MKTKNYLGRLIILVHDYDKASEFYEKNFGFRKIFDETTGGRRFLHLGTDPLDTFGIWFIRAEGADQTARVGNQTNGQPVMVIYTTSLVEQYEQLEKNGVTVSVKPVLTADYKFLHCLDLYGNEIVVVELKQ